VEACLNKSADRLWHGLRHGAQSELIIIKRPSSIEANHSSETKKKKHHSLFRLADYLMILTTLCRRHLMAILATSAAQIFLMMKPRHCSSCSLFGPHA